MDQFTSDRFTSSANHAVLKPRFRLASILGRGAGILTGLVMIVQLPALAGGTRVAQADPNAYPADEIQAYLDSCLSTASANGLEETVAQNYCNCTINAIQDRFTYSQFVGFAETIQSTQQLPNELVEVVQSCSPK